MKRYIVSFLVYSIIVVTNICSCGNTLNDYKFPRSIPRAIYFNDQLATMQTVKLVGTDNKIFVDIQMFDGDSHTGLLKRMSEKNIVISKGYFFEKKDDSTKKLDKLIVLAKKDVEYIKIW